MNNENKPNRYHCDPAFDMTEMHKKYGVHSAIAAMDVKTLNEFVRFRIECLREELEETADAVEARDAEETVDGLIDLVVFAIGTLDLMDVDFQKAWCSVYAANMNKRVGVKEGRPNPLGLPDLIKEPGWCPPSHIGNTGLFDKAYTS